MNGEQHEHLFSPLRFIQYCTNGHINLDFIGKKIILMFWERAIFSFLTGTVNMKTYNLGNVYAKRHMKKLLYWRSKTDNWFRYRQSFQIDSLWKYTWFWNSTFKWNAILNTITNMLCFIKKIHNGILIKIHSHKPGIMKLLLSGSSCTTMCLSCLALSVTLALCCLSVSLKNSPSVNSGLLLTVLSQRPGSRPPLSCMLYLCHLSKSQKSITAR